MSALTDADNKPTFADAEEKVASIKTAITELTAILKSLEKGQKVRLKNGEEGYINFISDDAFSK